MLKIWISCAGLLALAACGSGEGNNASETTPEAAAKRQGGSDLAATLQPGEYEMTTTFVGVEGPNVPPQVAEAMKGKTETKKNCITEKELKEAKGGLFNQGATEDCSENTLSMAGGRMTGRLKCGQGDQTTSVTIDGRYSAQSFDTEMRMTMPGGMTTHAQMKARRVGACPAGSEG